MSSVSTAAFTTTRHNAKSRRNNHGFLISQVAADAIVGTEVSCRTVEHDFPLEPDGRATRIGAVTHRSRVHRYGGGRSLRMQPRAHPATLSSNAPPPWRA